MGRQKQMLLLGVLAGLCFTGCGAGSSPFKAGGLYSVKDGETRFKIAKVLVVDNDTVHLRLYKNTFATRPDNVDPSSLSLGSIKEKDGFGIGHLPMSPKAFAAWQPVFLMETPVVPGELEGYRLWKEAGGGAFK